MSDIYRYLLSLCGNKYIAEDIDEILQKFKDKEVKPLWFAVDTEYNDKEIEKEGAIFHPIGFPYNPIWHSDDWILESRTEKKGIMFSKFVTEGSSAPTIEPYGSGKLRNENFIKTLKLLKEHESIAKKMALYPVLHLQQKLEYIDKNGVKIYGVVITGPSKEILKLKEEEWVKGINVEKVALWNWRY
jgi:hypothetical protein